MSAGRISGAHARLLIALNEQIAALEEQVKAHFLKHPDAEIYLSMPGIGEITGARVLAEFGDDPIRYASAKARKNYAGTSPITRASGKSRTVQARYVRNNRLADALQTQAFCALRASPGARRYYDKQRAREAGYNPALRQLGNRLVGILPRLPQDPHPPRRSNRVVTPRPPSTRLTPNDMGCLTRCRAGHRVRPASSRGPTSGPCRAGGPYRRRVGGP